MTVLMDSPLPNRTYRGKVRDTYDLGDRLLIVATDRISAFDAILPTAIPDKGKVLSQMSAWWFERSAQVVPNHFIRLADGTAADELPFELPRDLIGRSTIARKARRIDVECIVRGYVSGSAWAEFEKYGTVNGIRMPKDLRESDRLAEPMFTPTTKAEEGHDEAMTFSDLMQEVGPEAAQVLRVRSLALYNFAAEYARERGIIIADTKFEFGWLGDELIVIDEILTPDSSRFWAVADYEPGRPQASFDKQYVRDWLLEVRLEPRAAGAGAARRRRARHVRALPGGVPAAHGAGSAVTRPNGYFFSSLSRRSIIPYSTAMCWITSIATSPTARMMPPAIASTPVSFAAPIASRIAPAAPISAPMSGIPCPSSPCSMMSRIVVQLIRPSDVPAAHPARFGKPILSQRRTTRGGDDGLHRARRALDRGRRADMLPRMFLARVYVTLKPTVNDPPGLTIRGGLHSLGFTSVDSVRSGKYMEIRLDAR